MKYIYAVRYLSSVLTYFAGGEVYYMYYVICFWKIGELFKYFLKTTFWSLILLKDQENSLAINILVAMDSLQPCKSV